MISKSTCGAILEKTETDIRFATEDDSLAATHGAIDDSTWNATLGAIDAATWDTTEDATESATRAGIKSIMDDL